MRSLSVFNSVSVDGFFTDANSELGWAYKFGGDAEYNAWVGENAKSGGGMLVYGRKTYDMMVAYWPTPQAMEERPVVAKGINASPKIVFSRRMEKATWNNTTLIKEDPVAAMKKLKAEPGPNLVVMGSGQIVSQLAAAGLVDRYTLPVIPTVLGKGRSMFEGLDRPIDLRLAGTRSFKNGIVVLTYER
ncbi:MAG: dihydrofolate reductase [Kofleriaceae bacterium]|nr:dihydrofolate reductase [Kofleriaceae bacterium]